MARYIDRRDFFTLAGGTLGMTFLAGCAGGQSQDAKPEATEPQDASKGGIDYMALVNKQHQLPDGWEDAVQIVSIKNQRDSDVEVETKAYDAYLALKDELEKEDVFIDLDSAYRSVAAQQEVWDEFTKEYGEEYVKQHVAVPGYSEHQTGLALDLSLIIDGKAVFENEDMMKETEIWEKIHDKIAEYGFILRYLPQKKIETGYSYEPWHIRYLDDPEVASQITADGVTFERYLGELDPMVADCVVDYGKSELYTDSDIDAALDAILAEFSTWTGCTLKRFAFTDDDTCTQNLDYANELREAQHPDLPEFDQAIVFATDFHSPSEKDAEGTAWEPDTDYNDYTWTLGRTGADGTWQLLSWGYE